MTDRERLELAAKAAGMKLWRDPETDSDYWGDAASNYICSQWNPLTDDGDALRLAVKLKFTVEIEDDQSAVFCRGPGGGYVPNNNDPYAATRRAIVRAAAKIGRNMK